MPEATQASLKQHLVNRIGQIATQLEKQDKITGGQYTVADGYLYTVLGWGKYMDFDITRWPAITAFVECVAKRLSVGAASEAEGVDR